MRAKSFLRRLASRVAGRTPEAAAIQVTLWGKPDCSLCDKAHVILDRLGRDYPLIVSTRDISLEPDAFERYRYVIPVVEIENGTRFEGKITEHRLRQALDVLLGERRS